jgi:hypothetical protein
MPPDLRVPKAVGITTLVIDGATVGRAPDDEGRLWLKRGDDADRSADALTTRTTRLLDDDVPMRVVTQVEMAIAGKPRDITLNHALLPGFIAESLASALPARLQADGRLVVQGRPGNWRLSLTGRSAAPVRALALPADAGSPEYWSFRAHNDLRLVSIAGAQTVDPKQVEMPPDWRALPAWRLKPGDRLMLVETRRGDPDPAPDRLAIERDIRLDFDGGGYSVRDRITGQLSRSTRIEMADPGVLGRVTVDGVDQPVTRLAEGGAVGVELRGEQLNLGADSRIPGGGGTMAATGWRSDFRQASVQLTLPPGWRLLHAFGVDSATGSWISAWTLWDFFFVLVSALAAGRLAGWRRGVLFGAALTLGWHMPGAPQALWPVLLAVLALARVLPSGPLRFWAGWARRGVIALIALLLLPYAVQQFRLSMYPSLERPDATPGPTSGEPAPVAALQQRQARVAAPLAMAPPMPANAERVIPAGPPPTAAAAPDERQVAAGSLALTAKQKAQPAPSAREDVDPSARVGTGAGVPSWSWWRHSLGWQGPVPATQTLTLVLLPPAGTVVLRIGGLALMLAALATVAAGGASGGDFGGRPAWPTFGWPWRRKLGGGTVLPLVAIGLIAAAPDFSQAATPPLADAANASTAWPGQALLDSLRERLTAPPDCAPHCAEMARLAIAASGSRLQLRLEVHAQAAVSVPLPGRGTAWRPTEVLLDGQAAALRRGEGDGLWIAVPAGVSQVLLAGDVGGASLVEIVLPMPIRAVEAQTPGWTLSGQDASGRATGALSLARDQAKAKVDDSATLRDALPPFVRIERQFRIGLRWTATTRIVRVAQSRAPLRVSVPLVTGEAVNDDRIVVKDGLATLQLGAEDEAAFASTLTESARIDLIAGAQPNQIEVWTLAVSPQWHASPSGIAPVLAPAGRRGLPQWQPWPSEKLSVAIRRPIGVEGQTLTVDGLVTTVTPGQRATDAVAELTLRASQGGDHRLQLPDGAELLAAQVDGEQLPLLSPAGVLTVPITPGSHHLRIEWRIAQGMPWLLKSEGLRVGATGVDDRTQIDVPADRVVLAVGGPPIGPAVLFWGVLIVLAGVAVALARTAIGPLGVGAWFLLGVGIAQTSLPGAAAVVAWFFLFAARRRYGERLRGGVGGGRWFHLGQVLLLLWTLVAAGVLLDTVRTGLLGVPDLLIEGNGSDAAHLRWYADRFDDVAAPVWVVSIPVLAYRGLMLLWALWLAFSVLNWVRWGWDAFSIGGYWHRRQAGGEPHKPGPAASAASVPAPQPAGVTDPTDPAADPDPDSRG